MNYKIGDIVEMKKKHPCGSMTWEITRIGVDIKIKCQGCSHVVMVSRINFEKKLKRII